MQLLLYIGFAVGGTAICWWGSGILEDTSRRLSVYYQLPAAVQGAVITAIGSSFPELSSTVLATLLHGTFDLGVASVVGSALFNILVIPGVSGLVGGRIDTGRLLVFKDVQFYVTSVAVLMLTFALAALYYPVPGPDRVGIVTRPLALMPLMFYGLYFYLQLLAVRDHTGEAPPEHLTPMGDWVRLGGSLALILVGTEGLVRAAIGFGDWFGTPSFLWGLTVVAAGTSLPDMFVSVRAAHGGRGTVSLANVLGSNIFDLLVAVPAGIFLAGASTVNVSAAVPMMAVLALATLVLFVILRTNESLEPNEAVGLLGLYALFLVLVALETAGVLSIMT
ncbi:sodium:calcium antiporter [Salinibacter sp. 10B]|uniref:sodium:calcium antiporter n=1 Tax=Salinibacter sp. 10B TaxID=1923971 RepID=UPI000CF3DFDB|nr:sodium:calcium antiporter [Salinibacter sp. 10B]PQJ34980.1 sodium:calcium antiporter [Salinibacter sp. 10B]